MNRTVDLISYTILALEPIIDLEEAAPGSGSACGSIFINRIFADSLNKRFNGDNDCDLEPDDLETAMEHFERRTKKEFNGMDGDNIPMGGFGPRSDIKKGRLKLSRDEIKDIFEPVISEILTLIRDQIRQTANKVKLVLLVGGFGNSIYLQKRIQEMLGPRIEVKVSPNRYVLADPALWSRQTWIILTINASQTAVVRGALMKGLADVQGLTSNLPRIRGRQARKHYGTEYVTPYIRRQDLADNEGHSPERRRRNQYTGEDHVEVMKWFLNKVFDGAFSEICILL